RQVRQQWIPGMTQNSRSTVVFFTVTRSGQVTNLRIVRPSGSNTTDTAAISAIRRAAPFAPLPSGFAYNSLKISFTFNINVSGGLDLWVR
ncbi:MAG: energy transducer TonB family protein, partial [Chroococcidiopsis sp.]